MFWSGLITFAPWGTPCSALLRATGRILPVEICLGLSKGAKGEQLVSPRGGEMQTGVLSKTQKTAQSTVSSDHWGPGSVPQSGRHTAKSPRWLAPFIPHNSGVSPQAAHCSVACLRPRTGWGRLLHLQLQGTKGSFLSYNQLLSLRPLPCSLDVGWGEESS